MDISDGNMNGKPIIAAAAGTVTKAVKSNPAISYGLYVEIEHGNSYVTRYAHCSYVAVDVGNTVNAGRLIVMWEIRETPRFAFAF